MRFSDIDGCSCHSGYAVHDFMVSLFFLFFFLHLAEVKKEISLYKCQQASSSTSQTSSSSYFSSTSVFDSVVMGTFQITFHAKIHVNDVFLFFKNHF